MNSSTTSENAIANLNDVGISLNNNNFGTPTDFTGAENDSNNSTDIQMNSIETISSNSSTHAVYQTIASETSTKTENSNDLNLAQIENGVVVGRRSAGGKASTFSSIVNLMNNVIGAGMVTLPQAFSQASIIPSVFLMILVCSMSIYSLILLARCCEITNTYTYKSIQSKVFGQNSSILIQIFLMLFTLGSSISYLILIGDQIPQIFSQKYPQLILSNRVGAIVVVSVLILIPLSLLRDIYHLRFTSGLAFIAITYTGLLAFGNIISNGRTKEPVRLFRLDSDIFKSSALMTIAFTAHYNGPRYYQELKARSVPRFKSVAFVAFAISFSLYLVTSLCTYLQFGNHVSGDMLNNYPAGNFAASLSRLGMTFCIIFTFPLAYHSLRVTSREVLFSHYEDTRRFRIVQALILIPTIVVISLLFPRVEIVLAYKGSIFGSLITFILPATMYLRLLSASEAPFSNQTRITNYEKLRRFMSIDKLLSYFLILFGFTAAIVGVYSTTRDLFDNNIVSKQLS